MVVTFIFAPKSYLVYKIPLNYLTEHQFSILVDEGENAFEIKQQDNALFRQIRLITENNSQWMRHIAFVDCKGGKDKSEKLSKLVLDGFSINDRHFVICERSASMTREGILSFVDSSIAGILDERISLGVKIGKTVLSKWYAYRGLMLSSCHCLENWYPKVIVVADLTRIIPDQRIKYVADKEIEFTDKSDTVRIWKQKEISSMTKDIKINVFDGCGIHHPNITQSVQSMLSSRTSPTSILWRMPFIKGVTHEMDYVSFFAERGISSITDLWGVKHSVLPNAEPLIILTESMYKGINYFALNGTYQDWDDYWKRFRKYQHCIGVICSKQLLNHDFSHG